MQALASTSCASSILSVRGSASNSALIPLAFHMSTTNSLSRWQEVRRDSRINCALLKKNPNASEGPKYQDTEPHKYFDHVVITVRSGGGGNAAVLKLPKPKVDDKENEFKKKDKKPAGTYNLRGNQR